jgi:hypothetical protein
MQCNPLRKECAQKMGGKILKKKKKVPYNVEICRHVIRLSEKQQ